jgi:prepilin peptidase CpaA
VLELILTILRLAAIALLIRICWTDFRYFKIWNRDLLALCGVAAAFLLTSWPNDLGVRLALAMILFGLSFLFWIAAWLGAGDVKLLGIVGCLIAPEQAIPLVFLILAYSLVILLVFRKANVLGLAQLVADQRIREMAETGRIPYGVAISLSAITVILPGLVGALA